MDMELNDLQSVASFISEVGEGKYDMAKKRWLFRNYASASAKLIIWLFNHTLGLEQRLAELEGALAPTPESVEEDDKH